jgi:hypothetical protein
MEEKDKQNLDVVQDKEKTIETKPAINDEYIKVLQEQAFNKGRTTRYEELKNKGEVIDPKTQKVIPTEQYEKVKHLFELPEEYTDDTSDSKSKENLSEKLKKLDKRYNQLETVWKQKEQEYSTAIADRDKQLEETQKVIKKEKMNLEIERAINQFQCKVIPEAIGYVVNDLSKGLVINDEGKAIYTDEKGDEIIVPNEGYMTIAHKLNEIYKKMPSFFDIKTQSINSSSFTGKGSSSVSADTFIANAPKENFDKQYKDIVGNAIKNMPMK